MINKEIIFNENFVPKGQPIDTDNRGILSPLATKGRKHILITQNIAERPNYFQNRFNFLTFGLTVTKKEMIPEGKLVPEAIPRDTSDR